MLLKEQAETICKYLFKGKEDGRLNDTYSISRVISTIDEALGKAEGEESDNSRSEREKEKISSVFINSSSSSELSR